MKVMSNEDDHVQSESTIQECSQGRDEYEHKNMMRQDYDALFYRKINLIIELEQLQQTQTYIEKQIQSLAPNQNQKISRDSQERDTMIMTPALLTTKEAAEYHSKVRNKVSLLKRKGEMDVLISRLNLQRKTCIQMIAQLVNEWSQIVKARFEVEDCLKVEQQLLQVAGKHNLSKVILNFMEQLHQIFIDEWLMFQLQMADLKEESLKELRGGSGRSKKQIISNMTLYLQQYYSATIFKQFKALLTSLVQCYQRLHKIQTRSLVFIQKELSSLFSQTKELNSKINSKEQALMDIKIDIQIVSDELISIEKRLWNSQQQLTDFVRKQANLLLKEYQHEKVLEKMESSVSQLIEESFVQNQSYNYFHSQLSNSYRNYMVQYLKITQRIEQLQQILQKNNQLLDQNQEKIESQCSSERETRRLAEKISQPHQIASSIIDSEEEEEQEREWNLPLQTYRESYQNIPNNQEKKVSKRKEGCLRQTPTLSPNKQKENQLPDLPKSNEIIKNRPRAQRYLVKKHLVISSSYSSTQSQSRGDCREFELKLTKKYVILQPLLNKKESVLSICQKIELEKIKHYQSNPQRNILKLNYGCMLVLTFLTKNMDSLCRKLKKVGLKQEKNYDLAKERYRR